MSPKLQIAPSVNPRAPSAVLIDGDPVARAALASYLEPNGWEVRLASEGSEALALLNERPSNVVLADWSAPPMGGLELCARIRARVWSERPYVIVTTGRDSQELWRALAAGADDVLRKPFERREVETRLALARFFTDGGSRLSLAEATIEALAAPAGELVVRHEQTLARVMFREGKIVWVTVSPSDTRFSEHLASALHLDEDSMREVFEESRVTGVSFDRLLVEWNLADGDALRECMRAWFVNKLARVRDMPSPSVLFVPLAPGGTTFEGFLVEDIAPWMHLRPAAPMSSAPPSSVAPDAAGARVRLAMRIDGAEAAFALAVRDGTCLAQKGDRSHIEISWALARALQSMPAEAARGSDILLSTPTHHYVARSLDHDSEVLIVVALDLHATTSGKARLRLAQIASSARGAA
ncbi:MAG: response regulator [Polyangiaceae bacterium]